jgi:predicted metal-dependent peptidase
MTPNDTLAAARLRAREKAPYFTTAIMALIPVETPGLGTIGVTAKGVMMWDPKFVEQIGPECTAAILIHEVSHLLRDHLGRAKLGGHDGRLFNIAGDMEINPTLVEGGWKLPEVDANGQPAPGCFPKDVGMKNGMLAEEYYSALKKLQDQQKAQLQQMVQDAIDQAKKQQNKPQQQKEAAKDGNDENDQKQGERAGENPGDDKADTEGLAEGDGDGDQEDAASGAGQDPGAESEGSGGQGGEAGDGAEQPDHGTGGQHAAGGPASNNAATGPAPFERNPRCGGCAGNPEIGEPEGIDGRSEVELKNMRRETAEAIRAYAERGRSDMPGDWKRWADDQLKPPKVPWQKELARAIRGSIAYKSGATDYRYERPARRQAGLGYGSDSPILPALRSPIPRVAVWGDTSGSMSDAEMARVVAECAGVARAVGAPVDFLASDAAVHTVAKVRTASDISKALVGGGGTDFRPVYAMLEKQKPRPDVIIGITDGMGPAPDEAPKGIHCIWVLVGPSKQKPYSDKRKAIDWGRFIEVNEDK